ncbi:MAG: TraB/GumN family protein, partial [Cyanobacteria bacterium P01_H01_bin.152]
MDSFARVWNRWRQPLHLMTGVSMAVGLAIAPMPIPTLNAASANDLAAETDANFLWQIATPSNTVYLLGSIHFLTADSYPLPAAMEAAFRDAENLVLEADVGPDNEADIAVLLLDKALPEPGESLAEVLSPNAYGLAAQATEEFGLFIQTFEQFEPWFLAISLTSLQLIDLGFLPEYGVDQYFYRQAEATETPILFLETVEQQFDLFEQLSIEEQRLFTEQTLAELDQFEASFNDIVAAWDAGDSDRMTEILLTEFEDNPAMQEIFLSDRNRDWVEQILPWLGS